MSDPTNPAATPTPTPAAPVAPASPPTISYEDFAKLDLRVATVKAAEFHPNADKLLKLQLDDGTPQGRQVCAGIRQWYDPATLVGRQVVIVANLAPKTIRGEISQGMVLCASDLKDCDSGARDVIALMPDKPVRSGSKVS